jgi:AraC-like DNA-binding protein
MIAFTRSAAVGRTDCRPLKLAKIAEMAGMSASEFRKEFEYLT